MQLGRIEKVDPRSVWANESHNFTPWLLEHAELLGEALGLELDVELKREVPVGPFSADLVGVDAGTGSKVLVENQLERTDHSHLGQLLTYAGGLEVDILVWLATKIQEEHRQALIWLNESTREGIAFFGVELELLQIGGPPPAPHFSVVVQPNEWQKSVATSTAPATSERNLAYQRFWRALLGELRERDAHATTASPERVPAQNWYGISVGRTGFQDNLVFGWSSSTGSELRAELYIDLGDREHNKHVFDVLLSERSAIEAEAGEALQWDRRDDIRASRIYFRREGSIDDSESLLDDHRCWGAERMLRLKTVFGPRVKALAPPAG